MILINLLPHREGCQKAPPGSIPGIFVCLFLVGLIIAGVIYWWLQMLIADQQGRNQFLSRKLLFWKGRSKK